MHNLTILDFLLRLAVGVGCGALIGVERQWRARMAGLRVAPAATSALAEQERTGLKLPA